MILVIDANILFSILIKMGKTLDLVFNYNFEVLSPDFILEEFIEHKEEISSKSGFNYGQLLTAIILLSERIKFISLEEYKQFLPNAFEISPDKDDIDYFALALKLNCPIWSNDKKLKEQNKVKVYSTNDLQELFKQEEIV